MTAATQSDTETENLLGKAASASANVVATSATATEITSIVSHITNVAALGITGTGLALTDTEFAVLGPKLANAVTDVTVDATSASAGEITAMVTDAANIGALGITGTGLALTDTQFAVLGPKLANAVVDVTVNAAGATSTEVDAIIADIDNIGASGITGTFSASVAQAATVGLGTKVAAGAVVTLTGATTNGAQVIENGVFQSGNDKISLSDTTFTLAGSAGASTIGTDFASTTTAAMSGGGIATATDAQKIVFDATTGVLYYNSDGATAGGFTAIMTLTGVSTLLATDFNIVT